ncbi:hypothetical protein EH32_14180 [Erythrobacter litoralis]|uniref:Uncharacterized protein n=1 Tax=Erythrobacter litoralis TaxID=39960 RepID=A0A074MG01_9SPHN|nr:hypothetical protein EH32_14180 [Erythrobacter litoralis]
MVLAVQVLGAALAFSGAFWALQGLGIVMWPPGSFMLAQREWALYGGIAAVIGALLIWAGSRIGRR